MRSRLIVVCTALTFLAAPAFADDQRTDENALPLITEASLFMKDGKKEEATADFEKALGYKLSIKHEALVRGALGSLYLKDQPEKALTFLKRSLELQPEETHFLPSLGLAYERNHDYASAKQTWETYLQKNPDSEVAASVKSMLADLAKVQADNGLRDKLNEAITSYNKKDYDKTIEVLSELTTTENEYKARELEMLGMCYLQKGKYSQAIEHLEKSLEIDPKQPATISALASAYEGNGDLKEARACLKRYLSVNKDREGRAMAKDRMPVLKKVENLGTPEGPDYFKAVSTPCISRWSLTRMPLRVYIAPGDAVPNFKPEFNDAVVNAFNLWCSATDGKVTWTPVTDVNQSDIVVQFTADPNNVGTSESHQEAGICKLSARRLSGARIAGISQAVITMLTNTPHGAKPFTKEEIEATAAHEVGHSLGMGEHSANPDDVMFFAATKTTKNGLSDRDKATIHAVYNAQVYDDGRIVVDGVKRR